MKRQLSRFTLCSIMVCLTYTALNSIVIAHQPATGNGADFGETLDWQPDNRRYARAAANLNVGEPRTVRLFYFLPNDRPYRADVVEAMKTGILEVQSFYADQMAAHGHGNKTFRMETDVQGVPIVHRVNGDYSDSHYKDRGRPENEISRAFDISSIVQLVVMDISRSSSGRGVGIKQRGQAIIDGRWDWRTAAHELGHAFGLQHDFRDTSYIMSYGSGRNSLSAGAANYLAVNPYINHSIPLQAGSAPSVQLLSSTNYMYGVVTHIAGNPIPPLSVPVRLRVRDPDGLQQVTLFVKTPGGINLPTGYNEVVSYHNLSGQTDATVTFNYKGGLPSEGDDDTSLLDQLRHTIYVSAVDKQGNRIDAPPSWTLQAINIQPAKVPVSTRSPQVRDSIYNVVRLFHDRSVSAYEHITDAHLAKIDTLFVNNIELLSSPLQYGDFDGLTNLRALELRKVTGYSGVQRLPNDMFKGKTLLQKFSSSSYFPFDVRLQKIGTNQFKVVVPTGAPFDIELPLVIANGSINGGATSITIPTGSVESDTYTVTRTPGTTFAVTVDIEKFPSLPTGHEGYGFVKGHADLGPILKIFDALPDGFTHLNDRTPQVRDAIVKAVPEIETPDLGKEIQVQIGDPGVSYIETITYGYYANFVTEAHLAAITSLDLSNAGITELKEGDFDGLTNLTTLNLGGNGLRSLIPPIIEGIYLTPIFRKPSEIFDELTNLTTLDLSGNKLSSLPSGVFDELTNLTGLNLANNDLSSLSEDIFDELTNLTGLNLANNDLSSLPAGVFEELTNLTLLNLASNDLSSLPEDIFAELTNLIEVNLSENQLRSLPSGNFDELTVLETLRLTNNNLSSLQVGIFDELTNLTSLYLDRNDLSSLPLGIFDGFTALTNLYLQGNRGSPFSLTVSLVHVTDDQFKAVAPSGAPFDIVLPLTVTNGSISGSATSITIPTGSVDSQPLTVTRTPGTTAAATVEIGDLLPGLPPDHQGYALVKSGAAPLEFREQEERVFIPVSERTPEVRDAIVDAVPGVNSAADVTAAHLAAIPSFGVSLGSSVKVGDFDGLTGVTALGLETGQLTSLPAGLFNDLSNVTVMEWHSEKLITLPVGAFQGFTNLELFGWGARGLTSLPAGVLDPLTNLTGLVISAPQLNTLPANVFDQLTNLTGLELYAGRLKILHDDIFDQLTKLTTLRLTGTQLANLPDGVFDRLTALTELYLSDNQLSTLPDGLFSGLSSLTKLHLDGNTADPLPLTVSLEKVGVGLFKAVAPAGAPFDLILPINVTNGSINGGVTTLTIPAGSVESDDTLTVSHTPNATEAVAVDIGTLPGLPTSVDRYSRRLHQGYTLVKAVDLPLEFGELGGSVFTPVTDRTPQVRDLIVTAVPGVDSAADVTKAHLAAIPAFWLGQITLFGETGGEEITTLQAGDFDGLTGLTFLAINGGEQLSNVPAGIFDGLSSLEILFLTGNFSNLPEGVFDDLTALTTLTVSGFQLNSLPAGVFNELTALTTLYVSGLRLSSLPDGAFDGLTALTTLSVAGPLNSLPADIFDGLTALTTLAVVVDDTLTLPAGVFEGLTALTDLTLAWAKFSEITPENLEDLEEEDILTDPRPLTVSLEKVGTDQFKAVAPMGATFNMVLPVTVTNGSINGVTRTTLTIPTGSVESDTLTVKRTPYTTAAVTVNIGTLPGLPSNHRGYALVKSADLPLNYALPEVRSLIGSRTPEVRDAIVAAVPGVDNAADVTEAHLAAITSLWLWRKSISSLKVGDFDGLTNLEDLRLNSNQLKSLPTDIFSGLASLNTLFLDSNQLSSLPADVFSGLSSLSFLDLGNNRLSSLPADMLSGLSSLSRLELHNNQLSHLPVEIFSGLTSLSSIWLYDNQLSSLTAEIFSGLSSLEWLGLSSNQLNSLPAEIFSGLSSLEMLRLQGNSNLLPLTVSLERVEGTPHFKATVHTGAPFTIVLPLTVANGTIDGAVTTITIPAGSVESEPLTVTRTPGTTFAVTVDIGTLPGLPTTQDTAGRYHQGYELVKSTDLPIAVTDGDIPDTSVLTLTVGAGPGAALRGYNPHSHPEWNFGSLSSRTFVFKGVSYTLHRLRYDVGGKRLEFQTSPMLRGYELYLDSHLLRSFSAFDFNIHVWTNVNLNWSVGQKVQVRVVERTPIPPEAPTNLTATPGYEKVTLSWELPSNADPTTLPVTEYEFRVSSDGGNTWNPDWKIISSSRSGNPNRTSYTIGGGDPNNPDSGINLTNGTLYTFEIRARGGDGSGDAARITVIPAGATPVSQHTPQVRDAIVRAVPGVNNAADVTETHLAAITSLNLLRDSITTLKAGDFDGLTALTSLDLSDNQLSTLPEGIFDDLTALTTLELNDNQLSTLPADIFDALTKLQELHLYNNQIATLPAGTFDGLSWLDQLFLQGNQLTTLPAGIFDKLTALRNLNLEDNQLSSLPEGIFNKLTELNYLTLADNQLTTLPESIFDGPSALNDIWLDGNQFTTLPAGIFTMKASFLTLRGLHLEDNTVDPLPLTVSLEKVADGQFKAVAPAGATFDFVLQISIANGTINGGTTTLKIPKGSVESDTLTVTRTANTTDAVTVDIKYPLPESPTNHQGYKLVKSPDLPLEVISAEPTVVDTQRTSVNIPDSNLRAKIEDALGKTSGDPITPTEMATLTSLTAQDASISNLTGLETAANLTTLKLGDNSVSDISALAGLTNLTELQLWDNQISNISRLASLTNLTKLYIWGNSISDISALAGLTSLTYLKISENTISNISILSRLTNLRELSLKDNAISDISALAGLTNLTELRIGNNAITNISAVAKLTNLVWLDAPNNSISDISAVANLTNLTSLMLTGNTISDISTLTGLTKLIELYLGENSILDLSPLAANTGLGANTEIDVQGNPLSYPSIYTHIPTLQARNVYVDFDNRVATAPVKISGDTQQDNIGATLAQPFIVEVRDTSSVVFAGVPVTFAVTAGGGTLSATNTATNANGRTQSTLTLGSTAGTNTARVSVTGITQTTTFTATATTPVVSVSPIINRTPQVRDAIVRAIPGVNSADDVIEAHLASITSLNLTDKSIAALKAGDFDGLSSLKTLYLDDNQLVNLPADLFSGLSELKNLYLNQNQLTSLPVDVFSGLSSLVYLYVNNNKLTSLPTDVFSGLPSLTQLLLNNNQMSDLSADMFRGLSTPTLLWLNGNAVDPLPLTVSLVKVGLNQFKATVPAGAPFTLILPLRIANGNISSGRASNITITAGSVGSEPLTASRTPGTTAAVTVDIGTLPGLPTGHKGYQLAKSVDLPLTIISAPGNTAPVFAEGTSATRTIAENTATGVNIGTAVAATDADNDTLTYSLSGTNAASFTIVSASGQLQTRAVLDYETKTTYAVTIIVSDSSLTGTITVTINVTDIDETPATTAVCQVGDVLASGESCTYPGTDAVFSVLDNGSSKWNIPNLQWLNKISVGGSISFTATINEENYHFVAEEAPNDSWEIKEIGDDTSQQPVTPVTPDPLGDTGVTPTLTTSTAAPLTESTLHEGIITFNLSSGTFERSPFTIRDAITLSGITGVTVDTFGVNRVSDTQATVELAFDGNMTTDSTLTISLGADAIKDYDGTALTSQLSVSAVTESITASTASPLTEATLDESVVTLTLSGRKFERYNSAIRPAVSVSGISGVTVGMFDIDRESDTEVTVELTFDGDITTDGILTFTVGVDAIAGYNGPALTAQVSVSASTDAPVVTDGQTPVTPQQPVTPEQPQQPENTGGTPTLSVTTTSPLTESTLHGGIITLTLSDGTFERSPFTIRDAITLSGITGVTVDTFGVNRVSDTQATVELAFDGNMTTDSTLTISLGADAIKDYDGTALTSQLSVSAVTESITASNASPLTEVALDESVVTLTLGGAKYGSSIFDIRDAVTVSTGIPGVTVGSFGVRRVSDTKVTVELEFDGTDFDTTSTLTFTVGANAIAGYNGPALTAQISVTANTESVVASTASPLTEATLDESVVTLTLSGRTFERSSFKIRDAVTVSGIAGVTVGTFDIDRVSDTQITVELTFDGNINADSTLTFTVGADAIVNFSGSALTAQVPVTADRENALLANFPNPFNPETWIPYELEKPADVTLTIYALNGREVRRLALGYQPRRDV